MSIAKVLQQATGMDIPEWPESPTFSSGLAQYHGPRLAFAIEYQ